MLKGFVFGKFLPFHTGHKAMIDFALTRCDFLSILVCCSDKEVISCETRRSWIAKTYEAQKRIEIKTFHYAEHELPNSSETSVEISKVWSEKFSGLFPGYHMVITSESYGSFVASFMGIRHMPFDLQRGLVPTSATAIRSDLFGNWNYLADAAKPYFAIKVAVLGTESTGKTTLVELLAKHYKCTSVHEAGRDLIPDSRAFEFEDLQLVANDHARRIEKALTGPSRLVIIDTDIHITMSYANFVFDRELEVSPVIYELNKAALYLYLNNDAEYIQDGTRLDIARRDELHVSHRALLKKHNIKIEEISGNWDQRFRQAKYLIDEFIQRES